MFRPSRPASAAMYRRRAYGRRRRARVPRPMSAPGDTLALVRTTQPIACSVGGVAGPAVGKQQFTLNQVFTADITNIFRYFKVDRIVAKFSYYIDPASASAATPSTNQNIRIACANDVENPTVPAASSAFSQITAYANHKQGLLTADREWRYSFRPKPSVVANGSANPTVLSNEWLMCNADGITVNHNALLWSISGVTNFAASSTPAYVVYEFHFRVRGIA